MIKALPTKKHLAKGAALVEYALLVALIAVVCVTAMQTIGDKANHKLEHIAKQLGEEQK